MITIMAVAVIAGVCMIDYRLNKIYKVVNRTDDIAEAQYKILVAIHDHLTKQPPQQ